MDHKDLLNDVVKNMATTNEEEVVGGQMNGGSDAVDAGIPLYLSIGETYMMDAQVYDWEKSVELLPQMDTNMMGIRGIMRSLVDSAYGRKPEDDDTTLAQRAIDEFTNFFKQYQIDIDYKKYFEGKPDTEECGDIAIAMLMGFDAMNIIATIKEHTVTYQTIKVLQNAYSSLDEIMHDNEELNAEMEDDTLFSQMASVGNFDKEETDVDVELNTYNVVGLYVLDHKEDGSEVMVFDKVVSIEETAYIAADEQYLLEYGEFDTENMIATASGTIMAHDLDEAREVAAEFFVSNEADIPVPGHEHDMAIEETFDEDKTMTQEDLLRTFGFDSHDVSGLIDN